jgi:hypothetical protein
MNGMIEAVVQSYGLILVLGPISKEAFCISVPRRGCCELSVEMHLNHQIPGIAKL